jgi:hypothetical protein
MRVPVIENDMTRNYKPFWTFQKEYGMPMGKTEVNKIGIVASTAM